MDAMPTADEEKQRNPMADIEVFSSDLYAPYSEVMLWARVVLYVGVGSNRSDSARACQSRTSRTSEVSSPG